MFLTFSESPEWLDDQMGGQFYGYVTGTVNLTCQAEAQPPPTFRWLYAENKPVVSDPSNKNGAQIVKEAEKVRLTLTVKFFSTRFCLFSCSQLSITLCLVPTLALPKTSMESWRKC